MLLFQILCHILQLFLCFYQVEPVGVGESTYERIILFGNSRCAQIIRKYRKDLLQNQEVSFPSLLVVREYKDMWILYSFLCILGLQFHHFFQSFVLEKPILVLCYEFRIIQFQATHVVDFRFYCPYLVFCFPPVLDSHAQFRQTVCCKWKELRTLVSLE